MYVGPYGTKVVQKMSEYARDLHGLLQYINLRRQIYFSVLNYFSLYTLFESLNPFSVEYR